MISPAQSAQKPAGGEEFIPTRLSLLSRLKHWDDHGSWREFFDTYWKFLYCVAVKNGLSDEDARDVVRETVVAVAKGLSEGRFKVVDGSSVPLPDTTANQQEYPQPSGQKRECGFPVMKLAVLFSLASGALLDVVLGSLHRHDLRLFHRVWESLKAGDIFLGDRAYGDYVTLAGLPPQGVDVVARLHQRRKVDFRTARRLGPHDGVFVWRKGCQQSSRNFMDARPFPLFFAAAAT
jgi:hypothetical protein